MKPRADFVILQFAGAGGNPWPIAVLLLDSQDRLHVRARPVADLATRIPPDDAEVVEFTLEQMLADAKSASGRETLAAFADQLSNTIRISDRQQTELVSVEIALEDLYRKHVASVK